MAVESFETKKIGSTCLDLWQKEEDLGKILTGFKQLDKQLLGGIGLHQITEFSGTPGTGKTQMCLQLCLNVQIPRSAGGLGGMAMFIDTRQDFNPHRLQELAHHMETRLGNIANITATEMLNNVHHVRCRTFTQLSAIIMTLRQQLMERNFKLIVIDSLSFCLRMIEDVFERTSLLYEVMHEIRILRHEFDVAFVTTNEMTNRFTHGSWQMVSALGDTHGHSINNRVLFFRCSNGLFKAALGKTIKTAKYIGEFEIKSRGLRGVA